MVRYACLLALAAAALTGGEHPEMLVSTGWLAAHLNDPSVAVLQVSRERTAYDAGHIPGARFVAWGDLAVTRDGLPAELPPVAELQRLFERCGVSDATRVVLYGDYLGLMAARAWFTLDYLGHGGRAALLDGGLEKWRAEKRPLEQNEPAVKPGRFTPRLEPETLVSLPEVEDYSWMAAHAPDSGAVLIDARPPADYAGQTPDDALPRRGHIPGAKNIYWPECLVSKQSPTLRPAAELRRLYEAAGVRAGGMAIAYCRVGVQAAHTYFVLKYLGYRVRLYDGSFFEWSRSPAAPVQ